MVDEVADAWGTHSTALETRVWMVKRARDARR
jgi:hypothetical protein